MKRLALLLFISAVTLPSFSFAQVREKKAAPFNAANRPKNLGDSALLDLVQKQTFRYFWDFAHPVSGLSRERSNMGNVYGLETTTVGGTGFGIMTMLVAAERGWITRDTAVGHLLKILRFLRKADKYHGAFPHWLNGETGKTVPFSPKDDGADLVETSYLFQGLLCARQYFNQDNQKEKQLRNFINWLWNDVEWDWFTRDGISVLYWHWSPNHGWSMNNEIRGWNECLVTYILAGSSTNYSIKTNVYARGWANGIDFKNQREYYKIKLPLGPDYGGPLFFSHYSFLGLDPRGLKDRYADYWEQNKNHTLINRAYCVDNPKEFKGYGENNWGLTASDTWNGYDAHSPTNDNGTITPTAALSAFPYTPDYSMQALKHFYNDLGDKIWSEYGFTDAFNETKNWYADSHLAIDQGPIIVMIENYRSGLLWKLFMSCPEVQKGLRNLGFESPWLKK
ncbi:glucoamylase family protein [Terrimonas pollutisoli]|uniref:glucoamylase family protein n=1 Tax=Terrimonas pollutisoli TaxID=3034147 RepID=UPI0023ED484A|nr:glucoamylase family protein [Terrimonas sp. H1YJ31]